ncbi:MAG: hypothetical protein M1827_003622 [Pycnora praestabilis]|nr:MAG: hypothetical protein M1827_003622 [Pycnora praestabilis]
MEDKKRGFKEIGVTSRGAQTGEDRYSDNDPDSTPKIARWRNNLTALSQCHNLYFVAIRDEIHVFQPQFPEQSLRKKPDLILTLAISSPGLQIYGIDQQIPHAVNHLLVAELGDEEILACVCDDGDVIAYYTGGIVEAIARRYSRDSTAFVNEEPVRAFFNQNVGASAWGLAVHSVARLIAVSANNHEIAVFVFALVDDKNDSRKTDASNTRPAPHNASRYDVPTVSAVVPQAETSTAEDPWLDDWTDFLNGSPYRRSRNMRLQLIGHNANIPSIAFCNTVEDPLGWGVMFLDPLSFKLARDTQELFGCVPKRRWRDGTSDITPSRLDIRDANSLHGAFPKHDGNPIVSPHAFAPTTLLSDSDEDFSDIEGAEYDGLNIGANSIAFPPSASVQKTPLGIIPKSAMESGPAKEKSKRAGHEVTMKKKFALFHTTKTDLRMFQEPFLNPTTICQSLFAQHLPPGYPALRHFDRINLLAQIPELGIAIVATQCGRVALLTLTRMQTISSEHFAFRVDLIVPFESQECENLRPHCPLLGIAVGPIQGKDMLSLADSRFDSSAGIIERKRFRLLLTYYDHTILSYELERPQEDIICKTEEGPLML